MLPTFSTVGASIRIALIHCWLTEDHSLYLPGPAGHNISMSGINIEAIWRIDPIRTYTDLIA